MIGGELARPTLLPTTDEERKWPLHSRWVDSIVLERLRRLAVGHPLEKRLEELIRFISDPGAYAGVTPDKVEYSEVGGDAETMLADGMVAEVLPHEMHKVRGWLKYFCVVERKKRRRRGIHWTRQHNDVIDYESEMDLETLLEKMLRVRKGLFAACYDLTASFYQWELEYDVTWYYCFVDKATGKVYRFLRGAMGFKVMAELQDVATKIIATSRVLVEVDLGAEVLTHVDNVWNLGTNAQLANARLRLLTNAEYAHFTLNKEPLNEDHQLGEFTGFAYDLAKGTTWVPPHMITKLRAAFDAFKRGSTYATATTLYGILFHVSAILRAPINRAYHAVKWYRKVMARATKFEMPDNAPLPFWRSAQQELNAWVEFIFMNRPTVRAPQAAKGKSVLYTDASDSGWGATLFVGDGTIKVVAGPWSARERARDISERETMAVTNAARAFDGYLRGASFELHVDNTSAMWTIARGYSRSYNLNTRVTELRSVIGYLGAEFTIHYVRSAQNWADAPSRYFENSKSTASKENAQLSSPQGSVGYKTSHTHVGERVVVSSRAVRK